MAVAGVPDHHPNHVHAVCELALEMQETIHELAEGLKAQLELRIGIHTGPVVAGIIGTARFSYDLWGETVNMASRLESSGKPGRIQVSEQVEGKASDRYTFAPAGSVQLKGIGNVDAYWLEGRAN